MSSATYAAAEKIPTGLQGPKCKLYSAYHVYGTPIAAEQTDQMVARFIIPYDFRIWRADYSITIPDASGGVENMEILVDGTAVSTAIDGSGLGTGVVSGSLQPLLPMQEYAAGSIVTIELDTKASSTVTDVAVTLVIQPVY